MTTTTKNTTHQNNNITKPKRFRSDTNLLQIPEPTSTPTFSFLPPTPLPLWPFNLYHPSYIPALMNAIRLSSSIPPIHEDKHSNKTKRKSSFEIEGILNLSLRDNKRKNLSDTLSTEEEEDSI
jgi:hypothetical protein